jgi:hypothetical protein
VPKLQLLRESEVQSLPEDEDQVGFQWQAKAPAQEKW